MGVPYLTLGDTMHRYAKTHRPTTTSAALADAIPLAPDTEIIRVTVTVRTDGPKPREAFQNSIDYLGLRVLCTDGTKAQMRRADERGYVPMSRKRVKALKKENKNPSDYDWPFSISYTVWGRSENIEKLVRSSFVLSYNFSRDAGGNIIRPIPSLDAEKLPIPRKPQPPLPPELRKKLRRPDYVPLSRVAPAGVGRVSVEKPLLPGDVVEHIGTRVS